MLSLILKSCRKLVPVFLAGSVALGGSALATAQTGQTLGGTGGTSMGGTGGGTSSFGGGAGGATGAGGAGGTSAGNLSGTSFGGSTFGNTELLNTTLTGTTSANTGASGVASSNLFGSTMGNPLSGGIPGNQGNITFGQLLYDVSSTAAGGGVGGAAGLRGRTTGTGATQGALGGRTATGAQGALAGRTTNTALGGRGLTGTAGITTGRGLTGTNALGRNTNQFFQPPIYVTRLVDIPLTNVTPVQLQTDLNQVLAQTTSIPSAGNAQVSVEGNTVVLRGAVRAANEDSADRQRKVLEAMMRMRSGVRDVRNEMTIELPPPRPQP